MSTAIRRTLVGAAALLAVVLALGAWASHSTPQASAGGDPVAAVQAVVDAANASLPSGDGAGFAAAFTEDGYFADINGGSFAAVGRRGIAAALGGQPDANFHVTLITSTANGTTVTGTDQVTDANAIAAGVQRYVQNFTATVQGSLVSSLILTYDQTDTQTVTFLQYQAKNNSEGGPPPGSTARELPMDGTQRGMVFVGDYNGVASVGLQIDPGAAGVLQPAHIHTGTCSAPGPIVYPLASVEDGNSFTVLSVSMNDVFSHHYIVNVHLSDAAIGTYVSCTVLDAAPMPTARPAATATPRVVLPNTGSGGTADDTGWLIVALAAAGAAGIAGLGALRLRTRR